MKIDLGRKGLLPLVAVAAMVSAAALVPISSASTAAASPQVLRVGSWNGIAGQYTTIADAVNAAQPGDWVLVGPGDYHEQMDHQVANPTRTQGAVEITTANLHLRGMDRNTVVVDGTKPGSPQCSSAVGDQDLGPLDGSSNPMGRNGVEVYKADGSTVDNLTACNFLTGNDGGGNEIWWNGGDGSGQVGMNDYSGSYLSATTMYYQSSHRGEYGIFVSNAKGPGTITHTYGSNMADAAYYIGVCPDCNVVVDDAHGQGSALGYSGTNSGGRLIIQNSEFDQNKTGFSTNSQNNDDAPSPQTGICPTGVTGPTGTNSCWVFRHNFVHDNNNANVPSSGSADLGPPGTGVVISGGRHDIVMDNTFSNNGSWAMLIVPFIDSGPPPPIANCAGGLKGLPLFGPDSCTFFSSSDEVSGNTFTNNGGFGNVTNGDLGDLGSATPSNCYHGNSDPAGVTSAPPDLQVTNGTCGQNGATAAIIGSDLTKQVQCATEIFGPCPPGVGTYPRGGEVQLMALAAQTTMPDPCAGVPTNPWCPATPVSTVPTSPEAPAAEPAPASPQFTG